MNHSSSRSHEVIRSLWEACVNDVWLMDSDSIIHVTTHPMYFFVYPVYNPINTERLSGLHCLNQSGLKIVMKSQ